MSKRVKMQEEQTTNSNAVRLNKFLSDAGICSRREADRYIEKGQVFVNGDAAVVGTKVIFGDSVVFDGKEIRKEQELVLIAVNKPKGIVCTTAKSEPDNIIDFLKFSKRIYPIGRLDKESEGLILLTNDGSIVNKISKAGNYHEKEYIATVNKSITNDFLQKMRSGIPILETVTRPCEVEPIRDDSFRIILTQGLNRQIRRMCEYLGYHVESLQRVRIMNIHLGRLKVGGYRNVTDKEIEELMRLIKYSSNGNNKNK